MSRWRKAPRVNHFEAAARAKAAPTTWVLAGRYRSTYTAQDLVHIVRNANGRRGLAYQPRGSFDARYELVDDHTEVWVCYLAPARDVLAAGVRWLYETEQPDTAILQHHGATLAAAGNRIFGFCPSGVAGLPVVSVGVARPEWTGPAHDPLPVYPLAPGELDDITAVLASLGAEVHHTWNGHPGVTGSLALVRTAHPALLAAVDRYRDGCPDHPDRSVFCDCASWNNGRDLAVRPALTAGGVS